MPIKFKTIKEDPYLRHFVEVADKNVRQLGLTSHGLDHVGLVAHRARNLAEALGFPKPEIELCEISAFFHDMGNFIGRQSHSYWSGFLIYPILLKYKATPEEISTIMNAIVSHDKRELKIFNKTTAIVVIADKSDVRRSRVTDWGGKHENDMHDRVNYAATSSELRFDAKSQAIILEIGIDTNITPIMEYFEIFTERMQFCREAAEYLGCKFGLVINGTVIL